MTARQRQLAQLLTGLALGAATWALSPALTGHQEPFDAPPPYYLLAIAGAGLAASLWHPSTAWRAVPAVYLGEHLYVLLALPALRPTWLLGLLLNAIVPTWWPAALAAAAVYAGSLALAARAKPD